MTRIWKYLAEKRIFSYLALLESLLLTAVIIIAVAAGDKGLSFYQLSNKFDSVLIVIFCVIGGIFLLTFLVGGAIDNAKDLENIILEGELKTIKEKFNFYSGLFVFFTCPIIILVYFVLYLFSS